MMEVDIKHQEQVMEDFKIALKLQINQRLYREGIVTLQMYEIARQKILKHPTPPSQG